MSEWLPSKSLQITSVGDNVEEREPLHTVGGNVNWCSYCCKTVWRFLKKLNINYHMTQQFQSWVYSWKKNENTSSKRYMNPNVHSSTIYNSQDMETTQVPINRWMDKEVVYIYNGILFSHKQKMKFCHLQQHGWTQNIMLSEWVRKRKTSIISYHLYVESKK